MTQTGSRALQVWLEDTRVGVISEAGGIWQFEYDPEWVTGQRTFDLAPALPRAMGAILDGATQRPVQWFFDNLLPEEDSRQLLATHARLDEADVFGLLMHFGAESAGALTLLPLGASSASAGLQPLPDDVLAQRIARLPQYPLSAQSPKRMSLAGAQHKLPAVMLDGELHEPVGRTPSNVILKPDHPRTDQYPHSAANEWFCMALADRVNLPVPRVLLRRVPQTVYLVERFDRTGAWPMLRRTHVIDACQVLNKDRRYKYSLSTTESLRALIEACAERASTRMALLRWVVFNVLIGNGDAHLKNLSFHVLPDGLRLAPHYDLLSTTSYAEPGQWGRAELTMPIGSAARFEEVNMGSITEFAASIGVPESVATRQARALATRVLQASRELLALTEDGAAGCALSSGELRHLRLITHGVVAEAQHRMGPGAA